MAVDQALLDQLKTILRRDLKLGPTAPIADDMPLIGGDMDLDSLDILLLVSSVEKTFSIKIPNEAVGRAMFQNVSSLAGFIAETKSKAAAAPAAATVTPGQPVDWLALLPHGPAFKYVSKVLDVEPGKSAKGQWTVNGTEPFFAAHFPGKPIVPGVLLIEALAQVAGIAVASGQPTGPTRGGMLVHADVRFDAPVAPPSTIELVATVGRAMGQIQTCDVIATVNGAPAARGSVAVRLE